MVKIPSTIPPLVRFLCCPKRSFFGSRAFTFPPLSKADYVQFCQVTFNGKQFNHIGTIWPHSGVLFFQNLFFRIIRQLYCTCRKDIKLTMLPHISSICIFFFFVASSDFSAHFPNKIWTVYVSAKRIKKS